MKILIVEDDLTSRVLMQEYLTPYGICHTAENGKIAVETFQRAMEQGARYDLVCLDIMMPEMDGQAVLAEIRRMEEAVGIGPTDAVKVIMTTGLGDMQNMGEAFDKRCEVYIVKPVMHTMLMNALRDLKLIP